MSTFNNAARAFLAQKSIAVVGVTEKRETGCNLNYKAFKERGYKVYAVNPNYTIYKGEPCYADLEAIPEKPGAVFILANPKVTEKVVEQCIKLDIKHVWMHCFMGTKPGAAPKITSVSPGAVELCRQHGINVIPGSCPVQYLKADLGHGLLFRMWKLLGFVKMN